MNATVKLWLYSIVTHDLAASIITKRSNARGAWLPIEETRAIHLDAKFHAFVQGDLSINEYCMQFKKMADDLVDLGELITDRTLVLNLLCGLNEQYRDIDVHLRRSQPFPSFASVRNELLLEEINMVHQPIAPSTALVAAGSSRPPAPK